MKILANYHEIQASGQTLRQEAAEYENQMNQMLARMQELQSVWQGADSQAFIVQLEALRPKMLQLKQAMEAYAQMLIQDAAAYENLQANRAASARLL